MKLLRDLRSVEELAGEGDHAVHEVGLNEGAADVAFAGLVRRHAAIGEDEASHALWGEVVDEVLHPGEVGIALQRDAELTAYVVVLSKIVLRFAHDLRLGFALKECAAAQGSVGIVEGRVGKDVVGAEVGMEIEAEGVGVLGAEVGLNAPDGEIHDGQPARGGVALIRLLPLQPYPAGLLRSSKTGFPSPFFLTVDRDVAEPAAVGFHELLRLHEHAAGSAGGVVDAPLVRREHLDEQAHHAGGRVELAAILALRTGELGKEILVNAAEDVLGPVFPVAEADGADEVDEVDEVAEAVLVEGRAGVVLGQDAFQARIVPLDGDHGVVHDLADGGLLRAILQVAPAGGRRHPEDILRLVFVGVLGIGPGILALARREQGVVFLEAVGDVLEEDEAQDDVLVLGGVHVVAQLVSGEPELLLKAEVGGGVGLGRCFTRHGAEGRRNRWNAIGLNFRTSGFARENARACFLAKIRGF